MNRHFHRFLSVICLVAMGAIGCPLVAHQGQQATQPASPSLAAFSSNGQGMRKVNWFPYSADEVTVITRILADGTKITRKRLVKEYRDSQGRRREEWFNDVESAGQDDSPQWVRIFDPMAGVMYSLNPRERTAQKTETRRPTPPLLPRSTDASANPTPPRPVPPQPTQEDLGTQVIEGFEARGVRITRTIPAGAEGNDRPIQTTEETWSSANPPFLLMRITNDPSEESVMHVGNIVLEEPPADLFQVPPDYTVQELQPVAKPESPSD